MHRLLVMLLSMATGCASVTSRVRDGEFGLACQMLASATAEEEQVFAEGVDGETEIAWQISTLTAEDLEARVGVPAVISELIPLRVLASVDHVPSHTWNVRLRPPVLHVGGAAIPLGWPSRGEGPFAPELTAEVEAMFPPPAVAEPLPLPESLPLQRYTPTKRPRVRRVPGSGGGGNAVESAVTGFLSAISLGGVRHTGQGRSTLTAESRRALRRWHAHNTAAREAFEAEERSTREARREEIRAVRQQNMHRADALRAWRRDRDFLALRQWQLPSCSPRAEEYAELSPRVAPSCEWIVFVPRPSTGPVRVVVDAEVEVRHFDHCLRRTRHEARGEGALATVLGEVFAEPKPTRSMHRVHESITHE